MNQIVSLCLSHGLVRSPRPLFVDQVRHWLKDQDVSHHEVLEVLSPTNELNTRKSAASWLVELPVDQNTTLALHLLPTPCSLSECLHPRRAMMALTDNNNMEKYSKIIHLHEDVWLAKRDIVRCRILAQLGRSSRRLFARKTAARRIPAEFAISFLNENHLWGATKAKYSYGLFANCNSNNNNDDDDDDDDDDDELVAVATFSDHRKVLRLGHPFRSHELLRFCTQRNLTVVGGISKLMKCFIRDQNPDDIVTVVDRDWGDGSGWHSVGFSTVTIMNPMVMAVDPDEPGIRRHLVGAGIRPDNPPDKGRLGLPLSTCDELNRVGITADQAKAVLAKHNYFLVHDAGVERLFRIVNEEVLTTLATAPTYTTLDYWNGSEPTYAKSYYSNNAGIVALLQAAAAAVIDQEELPVNPFQDDDDDGGGYDEYLASWRASSGSTLVFSAPSSLDPQATVEVRERSDGWRTLGIAGGVIKSIYHAVYKVDPQTGRIEPSAVVADYIKIMTESFLIVMKQRKILQQATSLRMLHLGLGAGTLVRLLSHELLPAVCNHVAVELDSGVVAAMKESLPPLPYNTVVYHGDALTVLRDQKYLEEDAFDSIFVDIFDENNILPPSFYSIEYLSHLRDGMLKSSGVVMFNLHYGGKKRQRVIDDAHATFAQVFTSVHLIPARDCNPNGGNIVLIGSMADLEELNQNGESKHFTCI